MHSQIDRLFSYLKAHLLIGKKCIVFILNYLYDEPEEHNTRTCDVLLRLVTLFNLGLAEV